jgi:hypothetical protein
MVPPSHILVESVEWIKEVSPCEGALWIVHKSRSLRLKHSLSNRYRSQGWIQSCGKSEKLCPGLRWDNETRVLEMNRVSCSTPHTSPRFPCVSNVFERLMWRNYKIERVAKFVS